MAVGEQFPDYPHYHVVTFAPVLVGLSGLAMALAGCSSTAHEAPPLHVELHVDCVHGPFEAAAGALNAAQERTITVRDEDQVRTLHAYAGSIAIENDPAKTYDAGNEILDLGPAIVIAGTTDHEPDGRYIDGQTALTVTCKPSVIS
ncbi:MAG TPA: hypothetical protein VHX38_30070 [Pseudonocardiaceae bacterium]|jgi:hypothetical protein|nr:hypothetical protein [Pseudonocardiaceae bacterium]